MAMALMVRPSALSMILLLEQLGTCMLFNLVCLNHTKSMGTFKCFFLYLVITAHHQLNDQILSSLV